MKPNPFSFVVLRILVLSVKLSLTKVAYPQKNYRPKKLQDSTLRDASIAPMF
jgi:hypothetical protein